MEWSKALEFVKTTAGHATAGFIAGFLGAQVVVTPDSYLTALQMASFWGAIGALKQVLAFWETMTPKPSTGAKVGDKSEGKALSKYLF